MGFQAKHPRLQLAAMTLFVIGFVFAGSGWSLVIGGLMQHKAQWSVCGQDMCSCLPTTTIEPECPLCVVENSDSTAPHSTPTNNRRRLPKNSRFEAASMASQSGCASIFLSFVFGIANTDSSSSMNPNQIALINDHRPDDPFRDHPTPPPRA